MMRMLMGFVRHEPLPKIGGIDEAQPRQQIERAIDGGFVEIRVPLADARDDLVGGKVAMTLTNHLQDHFTLRREAIPPLPQVSEQFGVLHGAPYCN